MGLFKRLVVWIVLACLLGGVVLNIVVLSSCEFFEGSTDLGGPGKSTDVLSSAHALALLSQLCHTHKHTHTVTIGLYSFSVDDPLNEFDTQGECTKYSDYPEGEDVEWTVRAAQVCSIIAPCCGLTLLLVVFMNQCFCKLPFSSLLISLSSVGLNIGASMVWLLIRNDVCVSATNGMEYGRCIFFCF